MACIAFITFLSWMIFTSSTAATAFSATIAVLVVACPCAMGLATPMAVMASTSCAFRNGILLKNPIAMESAGDIQKIYLDKTGTITSNEHKLGKIIVFKNKFVQNENDLLCWFGFTLDYSPHPYARAVMSQFKEKNQKK